MRSSERRGGNTTDSRNDVLTRRTLLVGAAPGAGFSLAGCSESTLNETPPEIEVGNLTAIGTPLRVGVSDTLADDVDRLEFELVDERGESFGNSYRSRPSVGPFGSSDSVRSSSHRSSPGRERVSRGYHRGCRPSTSTGPSSGFTGRDDVVVERVGLVGRSRGVEAALLTAAAFDGAPWLSGIVEVASSIRARLRFSNSAPPSPPSRTVGRWPIDPLRWTFGTGSQYRSTGLAPIPASHGGYTVQERL